MASTRQPASTPVPQARPAPPIPMTAWRQSSSTSSNQEIPNVSANSTPGSSQALLSPLQNAPTTSTGPAASNPPTAAMTASHPTAQAAAPTAVNGAPVVAATPPTRRPAPAQPGANAPTMIQILLQRCRRRPAKDETPREWFSAWLNPFSLLALFAATLVLIGIIMWLAIWSHKSEGFTTINNASAGSLVAGIRVGPGLLWTFIPVLIAQIYGLWLSTTISAFADRHPYIELRANGKPADAKQSILLDYRTIAMFLNVGSAFKRRHFLLAICFAFSTLTTLGVTPFAAHLFLVDDGIRFAQSLQLQRMTYFDQWKIDSRTDLLPILNYVSGIKLYNATYPAWTDEKYSYTQFSDPLGANLPAGTNLSSTINATSLALDCRALENGQEWTLGANSNTMWYLEGMDRGCSFNNYIDHLGIFEYYMQTFSQSSCNHTFPSSDGRILLFATYASNGNFTSDSEYYLISCTSTYENVTGILDTTFVNSGINTVPSIQSYTVSNPTAMDPRPQFWKYFEQSITSSTTYDPTATYSTTVLGRLLLSLLPQGTNSAPQLSADKLASLMQSTISSIYAVTASAWLNPQLPYTDRETIAASATIYRSRLRTAAPIAWTFVGIFFATAILVALILIHTLRYPSILYDEPLGILGTAMILARSTDIAETAEGLRDNVPDGRWIRAYEKDSRVTTTIYSTTRWTVKHGESPENMVIVKT